MRFHSNKHHEETKIKDSGKEEGFLQVTFGLKLELARN